MDRVFRRCRTGRGGVAPTSAVELEPDDRQASRRVSHGCEAQSGLRRRKFRRRKYCRKFRRGRVQAQDPGRRRPRGQSGGLADSRLRAGRLSRRRRNAALRVDRERPAWTDDGGSESSTFDSKGIARRRLLTGRRERGRADRAAGGVEVRPVDVDVDGAHVYEDLRLPATYVTGANRPDVRTLRESIRPRDRSPSARPRTASAD